MSLTPREYLSWSSMSLLEASEDRWKDRYLYGKDFGTNRGQAFGKIMAEALEHDEMTGDPLLDLVIAQIPKFEIMDKEFRAELKDGKETIIILCKPDTMKVDMSALKEYKTSQKRWTRRQVDDNGQITFYVTGMYLITGKIPQDIELVEIPTKALLDASITATGDVICHPTSRSMADILKMMARMQKAWHKIKLLTEELL